MKDYFKEFKQFLITVKCSSENTVQSYCRDLSLYIDFAKDNGISDLSRVSQSFVSSYIESIDDGSRSVATINRIASSIKCYYKFLQSLNLCENLSLRELTNKTRTDKKFPEILTVDEIRTLINQPDTSELKGIRDKAILELLYATGIKATELINLDVRSLNLIIGTIEIQNSNKKRVIPLYKSALKTLSLYVNKVRPVMVTDPKQSKLFCNVFGEPLTRQGLWKIIKEYAVLAKINKEITPHAIRHSFAVHMLENGIDLNDLKILLGNTSITSIQLYTEIIKKTFVSSYNNFHPMSRIK